MTELEKMRHAHSYILNLANGIDPISGQELPDDTCLNNVRLSRCFFYTADILRQVVENGGSIGKQYKGGEFILTDEFKSKLTPDVNSLQISDFIEPINEIARELGMKKITTTAFTEWLVDEGYMTEQKRIDNKRYKEPTAKGEALGIIAETRDGPYGMYKAILYNTNAQKFMLDNMDKIVERWKNK